MARYTASSHGNEGTEEREKREERRENREERRQKREDRRQKREERREKREEGRQKREGAERSKMFLAACSLPFTQEATRWCLYVLAKKIDEDPEKSMRY